jgi:transposase-like protein
MSNSTVTKARKQRRLLSPSQKYEMYVAVLTGQNTQREAAEKWKVDRSTVTTICRTAKDGALAALSATPGRPGKSPEQVALEEARAEAERLRATVAEQAVVLHLHEGKSPWG